MFLCFACLACCVWSFCALLQAFKGMQTIQAYQDALCYGFNKHPLKCPRIDCSFKRYKSMLLSFHDTICSNIRLFRHAMPYTMPIPWQSGGADRQRHIMSPSHFTAQKRTKDLGHPGKLVRQLHHQKSRHSDFTHQRTYYIYVIYKCFTPYIHAFIYASIRICINIAHRCGHDIQLVPVRLLRKEKK